MNRLHRHISRKVINPEQILRQTKDSASRIDYRLAPSQWETALLCNDVSHLLGANLESALHRIWLYNKTSTENRSACDIMHYVSNIPEPCLNIKSSSGMVFHYKDQTVVRPSYLYNGVPILVRRLLYTMVSLSKYRFMNHYIINKKE